VAADATTTAVRLPLISSAPRAPGARSSSQERHAGGHPAPSRALLMSRHSGRPQECSIAARDQRSVHDVAGVYEGPDEPYCLDGSGSAVRMPSIASYGRSLPFREPDGNGWLCRKSRRGARSHRPATTTFASANDLASALRRAAAHTASTKSAPAANLTKTGPTGTPSTCARAAGKSCRNERLERDRHGGGAGALHLCSGQRPACRARDLAAVPSCASFAQLKPCLHKKMPSCLNFWPVVRRSWWRRCP